MKLDKIDFDFSNIKKKEKKEVNKNDIAVIGMSIKCSEADNLDEFWNNIKNGRESIISISTEREKFAKDYLKYIDKYYEEKSIPRLGYISDIDKFDYDYFNITPREAELMDPNQRLFLESAIEAIEDSGYGGDKLKNSNTGVYLGMIDDSDYLDMISNIDSSLVDISMTGNVRAIIASRISYLLNFKGPSMIIDTACSSSLAAVHTAVQALRNGECENALAGGIKLNILPYKGNSNIGIESKTNRVRTFDDNADGTVWGECVGVVLLKRLSDAVRDKDSIYAVIKGSCLNQDGKSAGITVPNQCSQERILEETWKQAGINPSTLNYIEAHGTGTKLGDPIEISAIKNAITKFTDKKQFCAIGSVKPNIGHTLSASGIAGMIKTILIMNKRMIPPMANFNKITQEVNFEDTPLYVNNSLIDIKDKDVIRCGVSSFGIGGTNAHVFLEKKFEVKEANIDFKDEYSLLTISAKSKKSLIKLIDEYIKNFKELRLLDKEELCFTANTCRGHYKYRVALIFKDYDELFEKLQMSKLKNDNKQINIDLNNEQYMELKNISDSYIRGEEIEWDSIYHNKRYNKVHIPVYKFDKKKCWIKVPDRKKSNKSKLTNGIKFNDELKISGRKDNNYTEIEKVICNIINEISGYDEINIIDNMSKFGSDSIMLVKFCNRLNEVLNIKLKMSEIYSYTTVFKLAEYIENKVRDRKDNNFSMFESKSAEDYSEGDIAIIGVSLKLPQADSLDEFWDNISNYRECITNFPYDRQKNCNKYLKYMNQYDSSVKYNMGGYMNNAYDFDYRFFNISPKEARIMDPNQRLFLQEAWRAIEDAGYSKENISGTKTGVYLGYTNDFWVNYGQMATNVDKENYKIAVAPNIVSIIPSRIAYLLDLKGPSILVDTACSSSLVAIHLACEGIKHKECDMAIAGGVRVNIMPLHDDEKNIGIESSNFKVRAFDNAASGTTLGEGVVAIILKNINKAIEDKDHIYAVIKASQINQDGASVGITSPNPVAQSQVLKECWEKAKINPRDINYIESHGTGTELGDPMEIDGINSAFENYTKDKQFCAIGSVKSNIGHLYAASGAASLVKCLLALNNEVIPGNINLDYINNKIISEESSVYFPDKNISWKRGNKQRICGISSFGISGTNCHLILSESPKVDKYGENITRIFTLSAKTKDSLWRLIKENYKYLCRHNEIDFNSLCYTSNVGRSHYDYRIAVICNNISELIKGLTRIIYYGESEFLDEEMRSLAKYRSEEDSKIEKIRNDYLEGKEIDWNDLYENEKYYKVSMPTYRFEEENCFIIIPEVSRDNNENEVKKVEFKLTGKDDGNYSEIEKVLAEIWCEVLGLEEISIDDNFYEIGGHSIAMIQIVSKISQKLNINISYVDFNNCNTIRRLADISEKKPKQDVEIVYPKVQFDKDSMYEKFELTDVQMSYLLGRRESFTMGGVCTHVYMEIETKFDLDRLNRSINKVIERHPMLNAIVEEDGTQRILKEKQKFNMNVIDLINVSEEERERCVEEERTKISQHVFKAGEWPLIGVTALKITNDISYLFIEFDMLIADGTSLQIIGSDILSYYRDENVKLPDIRITFRDYIKGLAEFKKGSIYNEDKKYWLNMLDDFPDAPKLVYKREPLEITKPHFKRLSRIFEKEEWNKIKKIAQDLKVSPSSLLCTAFAEVLAYWSNQTEFAINLTVFNRYPFHEDVHNIIGDFTSVMLIKVDLDNEDSFFDRVKNMQTEFLQALEHRNYDGVEFIRNLAAKRNKIGEPIMPIVFTSMLFNGENDPWSEFGELRMGLSQTPQVYLDHQAGEIGGKLVIQWDYVSEIFDKEVISEMFEQYISILEYLLTLD